MPHIFTQKPSLSQHEDGNILMIILLAITLIGALTAVMSGSSQQKSHIDDEELILHATKVQRQAAEFERGITFITQNGVSENDIRFAHPQADEDYGDLSDDDDTSDQLFAKNGGGATYATVPNGINDGESWEFTGNSAAPDVGSDRADLIAVLPNVTESFCNMINRSLGFDETPIDSSACVFNDSDRFGDSDQFSSSPNTFDEDSFSKTPAPRACVECTSDSSFHYYHVIMAR